MRKRGFTFVELLVAVAILGLLASLLIPAMARSREASARALCQANLKQLGSIFLMYAEENKGLYPRMHGDQPFGNRAAATGCDPNSLQDNSAFSPYMPALAPDYMTDAGILLCPSSTTAHEPNPLRMVRDAGDGQCEYTGLITNGDHSYIYFGYLLDNVDEIKTRDEIAEAGPGQLQALLTYMLPALFNRNPRDDERFDRDANLKEVGLDGLGLGNTGSDTVYRLRTGVVRYVNESAMERSFLAITERNLPIMWDIIGRNASGGNVYNHAPEGCNVLYLDGHVDFTHYAGRFPVTPSFAALSGVF